MSDNVSNNSVQSSSPTPPANPHDTPESHVTYEERRARVEAYIQNRKRAIDIIKRKIDETIQGDISRMEIRLDNGQAVVEESRNQAAELRRELTAISETHDALNEKYKKLMDEEDEEQRGKLLDEMKEIMQEAESNSDY